MYTAKDNLRLQYLSEFFSTYLLNPTDPLFPVVGKAFLDEVTTFISSGMGVVVFGWVSGCGKIFSGLYYIFITKLYTLFIFFFLV